MTIFIGSVLMLVGAALSLVAGIGVVRLPSALTRLHAAAKPASLGLALVALGAGVAAGSWSLTATALMLAVFQFLTAPIAGHLLGRGLNEASLGEAAGDTPPTAEGKTRRWPIAVEVVVVWVVLWRDLSLANVFGGAVLGVLMAALAPARIAPALTRPGAAVRASVEYVWSLLRANARMTRQVLTVPADQLNETLVVCDLATRSESVAYFGANATSFSPGTLTLEISDGVPYRVLVHAVGRTVEEVKADVSMLESSASRVYE